jgi:hypothetical protein
MGMSEATQVSTTPPPSAWAAERNAPLFRELARKYIWWMTPAEAMDYPARILAQAMNTGEYRDVCAMNAAVGDEGLRAVLAQAEAGQFNERSWHYWHYRLGLSEPGQVPPLPVRRID